MDKFTNINMLTNRVESLKNTKYNIDHWMFSHAKLKDNMSILDIGCGTGKQIDYLDKELKPKGWSANVVAIDKSKDCVKLVKSKKYTNLNVDAINCSIDNLCNYINFNDFDLIYSVYAIYYSNDVIFFIDSCLNAMKTMAQCLLLGNGYGSNAEIVNAIVARYNDGTICVTNDFIDLLEIHNLMSIFNNKIIFYFDRLYNKVYYTKNDFLKWWNNHPWYHERYNQVVSDWLCDNDRVSLSKNNLLLNFLKIK